MAASAGTKKSTDTWDDVAIRPMGLRMTSMEFFRVFEHFRIKYSLEMEDAYDRVVEICVHHNLALSYSS